MTKFFDDLKKMSVVFKKVKPASPQAINNYWAINQLIAECNIAVQEVLCEDFIAGKIELSEEQWQRVENKVQKRREYFRKQFEKVQSRSDVIDIVELE